jgi:putative transposase
MQQSTKKQARPKGVAIAHKHDTRQLATFLAQEGQLLLPTVELIEQSKAAVQDLLATVSRAALEALLIVSAEQLAGPKRQGRRDRQHEPIGWHGTQPGRVTLADRQVRVRKPRLRRRGASRGGEVEVPAYTALQNDQALGKRRLEITLAGVSTRQYERVLPEMAETVGISKSSVSREVSTASAAELKPLNERRLDEVDLLVIYIDGMVFGEHHVIGAIGVDCDGRKHVLGVTLGATENATVVTALLSSFVERGIAPARRRLFVIDGSKALRAAIRAVYGESHPVQRCRQHKLRNVRDYLPEVLQEQVQAAMQARVQTALAGRDGAVTEASGLAGHRVSRGRRQLTGGLGGNLHH